MIMLRILATGAERGLTVIVIIVRLLAKISGVFLLDNPALYGARDSVFNKPTHDGGAIFSIATGARQLVKICDDDGAQPDA